MLLGIANRIIKVKYIPHLQTFYQSIKSTYKLSHIPCFKIYIYQKCLDDVLCCIILSKIFLVYISPYVVYLLPVFPFPLICPMKRLERFNVLTFRVIKFSQGIHFICLCTCLLNNKMFTCLLNNKVK